MLGPYWITSSTLKSSFLWSCVFEAMRLFNTYNFTTLGLVADGASYNLSLFKELCGCNNGPFGVGQKNPDANDIFSVPCSFDDPFNPGKEISCIICPSHMLKNVINALWSSKIDGTKLFCTGEGQSEFGWDSIEKLWEREKLRKSNNYMPMVPFLRKDYIVRDSWTKLNVAPAKIIQHENTIAELSLHCSTEPTDVNSCKMVLNYLKAANLLFSSGLLSNKKVYTCSSEVIKNLFSGLYFFTKWYSGLYLDETFRPNDPRERRFLSFQTWDLLRLTVYGFASLVRRFHRDNPENYIIPKFVSGSPIESLFSQAKQRCGHKLTGMNYGPTLQTLAVSKDVTLKRKNDGEGEYRNMTLNIRPSKRKRR